MADILYLVKANRIRGYHLQNLAILAAPKGERFEISYAERWVEPGLDVKPGRRCALVIADSPYRHYQPLRWGVVEDSEWADKRLRLVVRLETFIVDGERLTVEWDAAAQIDAERGDGEKTRPYFVFIEPNHGLRKPHDAEEEDVAWRQAIDRLAHNDYFTGVSVARLGEPSRADGGAIDPGASVAVGTEIVLPLEVRSIAREEAELELALEADPPGALELIEPALVSPNDHVEVRAVLTAPGRVRARLNLLPDALRSSRPTVTFTAVDAPSVPEPAATEASAPVDGVRRLVRRLQREAVITDGDWIGLFEDFFVPWGGHDPEVMAVYVERLFGAGRHRELESVLSPEQRRSPRMDLLLLLAAIHNGTASDHLDLLARVDFEDADHFVSLLDALDAAPPGLLRPVVEPLYEEVLSDDQKLELIQHVLPKIQSDEFATALAVELARNDAELGVGLMMDRWPDPAAMPSSALSLVVGYGVRKNQLGPYVRQWLGSMAEAHEWELIMQSLATARQSLTIADRPATLGALAADLLGSDEPEVAGAGFELACDAAQEACRTGQLDTASSLADVLRGNMSVSATEQRRLAATALIEVIEQALEHSVELADWRQKQAETRYLGLVPHCRNKVLHLVGGLVTGWEAALGPNLELAELVHHESEQTSAPDADWVDSLDPHADIVVILWERVGHSLGGRVKETCRRRDVTVVEARSGERGLLDALEQEFRR